MNGRTKTISIPLGKLVFTGAELKRLPKQERAFMVSCEIANNDIHFFLTLCLQTLTSHSDDDISQQYATTRHLICVRNLSARVYEFHKLLVAYQKALKRGKLPPNLVVDATLTEFATVLCAHRFFEVMEWQRINVTAHYLQNDLPGLIDNFPDDHEFVDFEHKMEGNSLSILAEEIAFFGSMNSGSFTIDDVNKFMDWVNDLTRRVKKFRQSFILGLIHANYPDKALIPVEANPPSELVRDVYEAALPLFFTHRGRSATTDS